MLLEVGMIIYEKGAWLSEGLKKYIISRVTEKQAMAKTTNSEIKFVRDIGNKDSICAIGSSGYDRSIYYLETPEIVATYNKETVIRKIKKINLKEVSYDSLCKIYSILSEIEKII
jgi:hypothetical protein